MKGKDWFSIAIPFAAGLLLAAAGWLIMDVKSAWYLGLKQPPFALAISPQIAWAGIYCFLAAAGALLWERGYERYLLWLGLDGLIGLAHNLVLFQLHDLVMGLLLLALAAGLAAFLIRKLWTRTVGPALLLTLPFIYMVYGLAVQYCVIMIN